MQDLDYMTGGAEGTKRNKGLRGLRVLRGLKGLRELEGLKPLRMLKGLRGLVDDKGGGLGAKGGR